MLSSSGNSAAEIHNETLLSLKWSSYQLTHSCANKADTKSKKKRSSLSLQRLLQVKKLLHGLPSVLNKNNSIPQVHCAIRYPSCSKLLKVIKIQQQENRAISNSDVDQLCSLIREERAEELVRACMSHNAARHRCAVAILKSALTNK